MRTKTARISFALFCLTTIIFTFMLGVWQVQRLSWKENLLRSLEENQNKTPVSIDDVLSMAGENLYLEATEGRPVILLGSYAGTPPFFLVNQWQGQTLGVRPVDLFQTKQGHRLYVVGSFQSTASAQSNVSHQRKPITEVRLEAILRQARIAKGFGTIPNDLETRMLVRVEPSSLSRKDAEKNVVESFYVDTNTAFYDARHTIPNNHLGYAITWFMLSFFLVIVSLYNWRHQRKTLRAKRPLE